MLLLFSGGGRFQYLGRSGPPLNLYPPKVGEDLMVWFRLGWIADHHQVKEGPRYRP